MVYNFNFKFLGKLNALNESDKFKPFEDKIHPTGWENLTYFFSMICGDNRHMLQVKSGMWSKEAIERSKNSDKPLKNIIYTYTNPTSNGEGNKGKCEKLIVPFEERNEEKWINQVGDFKKFVFDLEKPGRRRKLQFMADSIKDGKSITDEDLKFVGLNSEDEILTALDESIKKRHEFICEFDYINFIKEIIDSGKYKDKKFLVTGQTSNSYSIEKDRFYSNYNPQKIYLADDEEECLSEGTMHIFFNSESLDDMSVEKTGKIYVNAYQKLYNTGTKKDDPNKIIPVPTTIVLQQPKEDADEKTKKLASVIKNIFTIDDDKWYEYNVKVDILDGAQKEEISVDNLTDEQKEYLDLGLITMEDIKAEIGKPIYGEKVTEFRFKKPGNGSTKGANVTGFTDDDFVIKTVNEEDNLWDDDDDL